jgi:hypothetical protein
MIDKQQIIAAQNEAVLGLANSVAAGWDCLLLNLEVDESNGDLKQDALAFAFRWAGSGWQRAPVVPPAECRAALLRLRDLMAQDGRGAWAGCLIEVSSDGRYRFAFSYDPPRRIRGATDDAALFKDYVPKPF